MTRALPRLLRLPAAVALVLALSAVPVTQVAACSCVALTPGEAAATADAVFTGTVVHEEPIGMPMGQGPAVAAGPAVDPAIAPGGSVLYTFEVDGVAKGEVESEVLIRAGGDGASCGMSFALGERWLVFATLEGDSLTTHLCSGNIPLQPGEEPPLSVQPPARAADEGGGIPVGLLLPIAAVAAVAAISAVAFWRAERPAVRG